MATATSTQIARRHSPDYGREVASPTSTPATTTVVMRDPRDLRRLLWAIVVLLAGGVLALWGQGTTEGAESDVVRALAHLPQPVVNGVLLTVQVLHLLLFLGIPLILLIRRRWRRWAVYTLGYILAAVVVTVVGNRLVPDGPALARPASDINLDTWPTTSAVATGVVALTLLAPHLNRAWIRFGWVFISILAIVRVVTSHDVVLDLVLAFGIGGVIGNGLLLAFGRQVQVPTAAGVADSLRDLGLPVVVVTPRHPADPVPVSFQAGLQDGRMLHCRVVTSAHREADSLQRGYRRLRVRGVGEDQSFGSVRQAATVETMLAVSAAQAGVRTPGVRGLNRVTGDDEVVIAYDQVAGRHWDELPAAAVTDRMLDEAWQALAILRRERIAHRNLQAHCWVVDDQDHLWLTDFAAGEAAASPGALNADVAELLSATYAIVGSERAVAAAMRVVGAEILGDGLGYLVPAALSRETRSAIKENTDGLDALVAATATVCGVEEPAFAPIERVKPRTLVMALLLVVAVYVLLPQFAQLPQMIDAIKGADVWLAGAAALGSLATYVGTALALIMALPIRVPFIRGLLAAFSTTFAGAIAPPGVAHVGLTIRFAQKQGLATAPAVSAMAAKETGIVVVHLVLLVGLGVVAGSDGALQDELDKLPSGTTLGLAAAVVLSAIGLAFAFGPMRRAIREKVWPAVQHSMDTLRQLASDPWQMFGLFVGALLVQTGYIGALYFSVQALGLDIGVVTVGLIYLTVGSAASVAPTPGGVGAVEAVLLGALTGVGAAAAPALAAVFLFRLLTFWIPIPIGGLSMRWMISRNWL